MYRLQVICNVPGALRRNKPLDPTARAGCDQACGLPPSFVLAGQRRDSVLREGVTMEDIRFLECDADLEPTVLGMWEWLTEDYLHLDDGFCLVAMDGQKAVGVIGVYPRRLPSPLEDTYEGYIDVIGVLEAYQRLGVARRLVEMSIDRCREDRLHQIRAWSTRGDADGAIRLWKTVGFGLCPATTYPRGQQVEGYFATYLL